MPFLTAVESSLSKILPVWEGLGHASGDFEQLLRTIRTPAEVEVPLEHGLSVRPQLKKLRDFRAAILRGIGEELSYAEILGLNDAVDAVLDDLNKRFDHRLSQLLDEAPLPIGFYMGEEQRFVYINKLGSEIVGRPAAEILGKRYLDLLPEATDRVENNLTVYRTGEMLEAPEMELKHKLGKYTDTQYYNFFSRPFIDRDGVIKGVISYATNATSEVKQKQAVAEYSRRMAELLDHLPTGYFTVDRDWRITYANPASKPALGGTFEQIDGKNLWELHPGLVGSAFYDAYHQTMQQRITMELENYYPDQDKWYHVVSYPLDEGIAVSFKDITRRKKDEFDRALADERFRTLSEVIPQLVWICTEDGQTIYFNSSWMERTGTTLEDNLGAGWVGRLHPEDVERTIRDWEGAVKTGGFYDTEYRIRMADGSFRWHVARGSPVRDHAGRIVQWMGTSTDIHDQKAVQEELRVAIAARDQFMSIASHELKTPLTTMKLQVQLSKRKLDKLGASEFAVGQEINKALGNTEKNIWKLNLLVDEMLDMSRITAGRLRLNAGEVDLGELVLDMVERLRPLTAPMEIVVNGHEVPVIGTWDRFRLEQVLTNLITNAHRYGTGESMVLSFSADEGLARFSVSDQGPGIPAEDMARIFERFERGSNTASAAGLGLGLFIVREIVQLHGGRVWVESDLGKGSEFVVELPLRSP